MITLQFMPYGEIEGLSPNRRIKKILDIVKEDKIVILEGRLNKSEETELIRRTMEQIDDSFKGIEISVVYPEARNPDIIKQIRQDLANILLGNRVGLTIVGPATIVKEIKKDLDRIQVLTEERTKPKRVMLKKRGKRWVVKKGS